MVKRLFGWSHCLRLLLVVVLLLPMQWSRLVPLSARNDVVPQSWPVPLLQTSSSAAAKPSLYVTARTALGDDNQIVNGDIVTFTLTLLNNTSSTLNDVVVHVEKLPIGLQNEVRCAADNCTPNTDTVQLVNMLGES